MVFRNKMEARTFAAEKCHSAQGMTECGNDRVFSSNVKPLAAVQNQFFLIYNLCLRR